MTRTFTPIAGASAATVGNQTVALIELAKFFQLSVTLDGAPQMFSTFIDGVWHELLESEDYADISIAASGEIIEHVGTCGSGPVEWISEYHNRFGAMLPKEWFCDRDGHMDEDAYDTYRNTGEVVASWNCKPARPTKK